MTLIQKTIIGIGVAAAATIGVYQHQRIGELSQRIEASEQQHAAATAQLEAITRERDEAAVEANALRTENARLTQAVVTAQRSARNAGMAAPNAATATPQPSASANGAIPASIVLPATAEQGRALGEAVVRGEAGALDQLRALSRSTQQSFNTNVAGLNDQQRQNLHRETFAPMREAFGVIEQAALEGNERALRAIADAAHLPELQSRAVSALGKLAARGDDNALNSLINGESFGFNRSSIVSALRPVADTGNQRAIDALASVARDPSTPALWYMAADGLSAAAEAGNQVAVDALVHLSNSATNKNVYNAVIGGLKRAAYKGNPTAAETLRGMGIR